MNYGLLPPEKGRGTALNLRDGDKPDQFCIQLYERVVAPVGLAGKNVLEVGSGRGGGASYLARYHQPGSVMGIDYSPPAVAFCRQHHRGVANLEFKVGDAENLPFPETSFDVVVNVESSHCYGNMEKFFNEVARVLRPGGCFAYADLRGAAEMEALKMTLNAQPKWEMIEQEDVTSCVAAALAADDARKRKMIEELVPPGWRPVFAEFAGVSGGQVFQGLQKRELLYFRFVFRRR